jgi:hypothetical protein
MSWVDVIDSLMGVIRWWERDASPDTSEFGVRVA